MPLIMEVAPQQVYINSGDWVKHRTYATISAEGVAELQEWS